MRWLVGKVENPFRRRNRTGPHKMRRRLELATRDVSQLWDELMELGRDRGDEKRPDEEVSGLLVEAIGARADEGIFAKAMGVLRDERVTDWREVFAVEVLGEARHEAAVDVVINNTGVSGRRAGLGDLDLEDVMRTFNTNALGAVRVTRAFLPHLRRGAGKRVAHISSGMGSISDNTSGGAYGYRMSKAALNMASKSMSIDLRGEGIISVVLNPGWVQTDMGGASAPTRCAGSCRSRR